MKHLMKLTIVALLLASTSLFAQKAANFEAHYDALAATGQFSGTIRIEKEGAVIFEKSYGEASRELAVPNKNSTVYKLGAATQPFIAMALKQAAAAGKINLDMPVSSYVSDFAPITNETAASSGKKSEGGGSQRQVTVKELLNHMSGVPDFLHSENYISMHTCGDFNHDAFMKDFINKPLDFSVGSASVFSHSNYFLAGLVLERVYGKPLTEVFAELLLTAQGIKTAGIDNGSSIIAGLGNGYSLDDQRENTVPASYVNVDFVGGAAAMYATAADISKLITAYGNFDNTGEGAKKGDPMEALLASGGVYVNGWKKDVSLGKQVFSITGPFMGYVTAIDVYPSEAVRVIALSNLDYAMVGKVRYDAAAMLFGMPYMPNGKLSEGKINTAELTSYAGKYSMPLMGQMLGVEVKLEGDKLKVGNDNEEGMVDIVYVKDGFFFVANDPNTLVHFVKDASGAVTSLELIGGNDILKASRNE